MVQILVETPLGQFRELSLVVSLDGTQVGIVSLDLGGLRSNLPSSIKSSKYVPAMQKT